MNETPIVDYIFPLIRATVENNTVIESELIGTGFLIGENGYALTAAHVIEQLTEDIQTNNMVLALFLVKGKWTTVVIDSYEKHSSEDVGIIKLVDFKRKSFLRITDSIENASAEYNCWGYPHEVANELKKLDENAAQRPDLIYTQGYVRRRISNELYPTMIFRGKQFYELSETVGGGNSGAPLILRKSLGREHWLVFGVYIGEKSNGNISYGVRAEAFAHWTPTILGTTIINESKNIA
jgi:V8-like Glu-specific endopeptidase